jgi:hypothetical protein
MSFEAESNSELTVIIPAYQLHFRFPVQNKIQKQKMFSDTRTGILGSIAGPCDFRSDEFQKHWKPERVLSFNMGWRISVFYPKPLILISANPC